MHRDRIIPVVMLFPLCFSILLTRMASAEEQETKTSGMYLNLGGGTDIQIAGSETGVRPAVQVGVGSSWDWMSLDINLLWNTSLLHVGMWVTDHTGMPLVGGADYSGHLIGLLAYGRFYMTESTNTVRPFGVLGVGGNAFLIQYSGPSGTRPACNESETLGGIIIRGGAGLELSLVDYLSLDFTAAYSYTRLLGSIDCTSPEGSGSVEPPVNLHSINVVTTVKLSF